MTKIKWQMTKQMHKNIRMAHDSFAIEALSFVIVLTFAI